MPLKNGSITTVDEARSVAAPARAASAALAGCSALIVDLPVGAYSRPSRVIAGSTIGQHIRHTLDHFAAALAALDGAAIDYDHRERDTPVEHDPAAALELIATMRDWLASIDEATGEAAVRVRVMLSAAGDTADLGSTLGRELAFAAHHATHHHAMIAAIAREHGASVPADLGKAPSTLHHEGRR